MKSTGRFGMVLVLVCGVVGSAMGAEFAKEMNGLPLVFEDSFDGGREAWVATDENAWEIVEEDDNKVLGLVRGSKYEPPVRSPLNIIRVKDLEVTDFVIEARLKQTGREYGHRDLCVFFGYNDPSHFYYVHMATKADDHANSIFIVNGEPRLSIAKERTKGTDWATGYHTVRVQRDTASGTVKVFFDDMEKPIMVAEDKTFLSGGIGFGSFDDVGCFDDVRVWAKKKE